MVAQSALASLRRWIYAGGTQRRSHLASVVGRADKVAASRISCFGKNIHSENRAGGGPRNYASKAGRSDKVPVPTDHLQELGGSARFDTFSLLATLDFDVPP